MLCFNYKGVAGFLLISILTTVGYTRELRSLSDEDIQLVNGSVSENDFEGQLLEFNQSERSIGVNNLGVEETTIISPTTNATTTVSSVPVVTYWYKLNTPKLILLSLVSLGIPVVFMSLLMWRMHKEKNCLPILLLMHKPDQNYNVVQLHNALFDAPPEYDAVIKTPLEESKPPLSNPSETANSEEPPPPSYSTVYI
ncbi:hypothetical protein Ocin01_06570 [Orchesella cincta]|uniref:Uncharacterized protein n=1 Tax=Orchesella cincta TaxID=48709 RepID=A0A1D2N4C4_ORCCI|nr:hypothetical protein Ocin01_06570 [Orchesella cincta]